MKGLHPSVCDCYGGNSAKGNWKREKGRWNTHIYIQPSLLHCTHARCLIDIFSFPTFTSRLLPDGAHFQRIDWSTLEMPRASIAILPGCIGFNGPSDSCESVHQCQNWGIVALPAACKICLLIVTVDIRGALCDIGHVKLWRVYTSSTSTLSTYIGFHINYWYTKLPSVECIWRLRHFAVSYIAMFFRHSSSNLNQNIVCELILSNVMIKLLRFVGKTYNWQHSIFILFPEKAIYLHCPTHRQHSICHS